MYETFLIYLVLGVILIIYLLIGAFVGVMFHLVIFTLLPWFFHELLPWILQERHYCSRCEYMEILTSYITTVELRGSTGERSEYDHSHVIHVKCKKAKLEIASTRDKRLKSDIKAPKWCPLNKKLVRINFRKACQIYLGDEKL